jgi:hypothetical protein
MKFILPFFLSIGIFVSAQPNDCIDAVPGCTTPSFAIAPNNPATNIVDFTSGSISNPSSNPNSVPGNSGCLLSGETSSTFITISVVTSGTLAWSIIGPSGGCFDWIMWPYVNPTVTCGGITGNTIGPVACNWNGMCNGNTGMAPAGSLPPGGDQSSYETPLNVTAGQQFLLCLSNYSGTSQNVNLNFFGSAGVACGVSAPDQTICQGATANVTIATPGLTAPQFNWLVTNGVSNTTGGNNVAVTPSVTTTYQVEVFQPATATTSIFLDTAVFTITVVPPPTPNAGIDDTVCLGQPILLNGIASSATNTHIWQHNTTGITPVPTVTYTPNTASLTPSVMVNQVGLYSFILNETNTTCGTVRDTVRVLVSQIAQTTSFVQPSCFGFTDGEIHINSPNADEYSFDNGITWQVDSFMVALPAGPYSVCSRNADGCQICSNVTITNPAQVTISVSNDTLICQNGTAQLSATATGGTTYLFHWDQTTDTGTNQSVTPLVNTTYTVYAENENGCVSTPTTIDVTIRNPLSGTITLDLTICPGYPTDLIATVIGGIGVPYTFTWSSGDVSVSSSDTISANPPVTLTYTVTVTDQCESTPLVMDVVVTVAPLPDPQISVDVDKECEPAVFVLQNETDPTMVDHLTWNISDGQTYTDIETVVTDEMYAGFYNVQLIVTTPQGCIDSTTFYNYLTVHPKPIADFRHSPNPVYMFNTIVHLTNYTVNGDTYQWFIQDGNPSYSEMKHLQTLFPDGVEGKYEVMLVATSEFGCVDTAIRYVLVLPEVIIYVPNTFTPDNDEYNQDWGIHIEGIDIYNFELLVFNRWGEVIWDGGEYVQNGTYTWVIRAKDRVNDDMYTWNGYVNVLK